jgi:hypothetical protein
LVIWMLLPPGNLPGPSSLSTLYIVFLISPSPNSIHPSFHVLIDFICQILVVFNHPLVVFNHPSSLPVLDESSCNWHVVGVLDSSVCPTHGTGLEWVVLGNGWMKLNWWASPDLGSTHPCDDNKVPNYTGEDTLTMWN